MGRNPRQYGGKSRSETAFFWSLTLPLRLHDVHAETIFVRKSAFHRHCLWIAPPPLGGMEGAPSRPKGVPRARARIFFFSLFSFPRRESAMISE